MLEVVYSRHPAHEEGVSESETIKRELTSVSCEDLERELQKKPQEQSSSLSQKLHKRALIDCKKSKTQIP
ncbi:MAG: hypothetical protein ACPGJV_00650 [Bacteriovoracaceae bacterium]